MKFVRRARRVLLVFLAIVLATSPLHFVVIAEPSINSGREIIKVFFPLQDGFATVDEAGNYGGYTYEYLMRISQLTGWEYEFHPVEFTNENFLNGLEKVSNGELHLSGAMSYSDQLAEKFEYSIPYGETNYALVALNSNKALNSRTLNDFANLRVAIIESAVGQNKIFDSFCKENDITYQPVYAKNNSECRQLLNEGLVDVLISKDIARNKELKIVAEFTPTPFFFAASKDNSDIIQKLNFALRAIKVADPNFHITLHDKYFNNNSAIDLELTQEELDYLDSEPVIRVAVLDGRAPVQSYNEETGKFSGIIIDIISLISERSGLKFELINVDNEREMQNDIDSSGYDVVAGIPYYYGHNAATGTVSRFLLTPPVFSSPIIRIGNQNSHANSNKVLVASSIKNIDTDKEIVYISSIEDMFQMVNSGEYSEAYINGYMAQHFAESGNYPNVSLFFVPEGNYELCLGVSRKCDIRLISVLTQAIATISDVEMVDIIYKNTNQEVDNSIWKVISRDPAQVTVPVIIFLIVVLGLLILLFVRTRRLNKFIDMEKNLYKTFSEIDRLSHTYNNTEFKRLAMEYLARDDKPPNGALVVCDIDNFKLVNDTFGHLKGDEVISRLGNLMNILFCDNDIVGRLGGDEFAILLKDVSDLKEIESRCIMLKQKSRTVVSNCEVNLSMGVAVFNGNVDFDTLFCLADSALYDVKSSGKNNYKIYVMGNDENQQI